MPRHNNALFKKRKGVFNKKKVSLADGDVVDPSEIQVVSPDVCLGLGLGPSVTPSNEAGPSNLNASRRKLQFTPEQYADLQDDNNNNVSDDEENVECTGNEIVDISLLSLAVRAFVKCGSCGSANSVTVSVIFRKGLASKLSLDCQSCKAAHPFASSEKRVHSEAGVGDRYDVNTRFTYALRTIGKGQTSADTLCAVMNLPRPLRKFNDSNLYIGKAVEEVAVLSMKEAVKEAVEKNGGATDIAAALDGSWHRRGHNSKNGTMTITSMETGKVMDVEVLTKHCRCIDRLTNVHSANCQANYEGSSGGMEIKGALAIFNRSVETRGVRYTKYLGDGDSKAFNSVVAEKPYGDGVEICKLECCGHMQKRMGGHLRRKRKSCKGKKLSDGKLLYGKNRLTESEVDLLQTYYGLAIRRNVNDLEKMKKAVWATYFHKISTDDDPHHSLCTPGPDSWCGFQKAAANGGPRYKHTHSLPAAVMEEIKPIFRTLANTDLLEKCLHGKTQNANESFNNIIWTRIPKTVFVELTVLRFGVHDAVLAFNDGNIGRCRVLKHLGISPGAHMLSTLPLLDRERLRSADKATTDFEMKARQARRNQKRRMEEAENNVDDPEYGAGIA